MKSAFSGGTLNIAKCNEGNEGASVDISGGEITIVCQRDDGPNAANGTPVPGMGNFLDCIIRISGGICLSTPPAMGLINGALEVTGGQIYVPPTPGRCSPGYDGTATITAGTVIAAGNSGMAQNFGTDSPRGPFW